MNHTTKKVISLRLSEKVLVSSYYIDFSKSDNKDAIIKEMVSQIKENPNFVLGDFKDEKSLAISLKRKVFGDTKTSALKSIIPSVEEITKIYNEAFIKSFNALPINGNVDIYILPLCNEGASKDLDGVNGFVVDGVNVFYLLIDTKHPEWRTSLAETVPHEYAHMAYTSKFEWNSILDGMVNEGLAEHKLVMKDDIRLARMYCEEHDVVFNLWGFLDRSANVKDYSNHIYRVHVFGCEQNRPAERIHITFTGEVILCCQDWSWNYRVGNVLESTIRDIWTSDLYEEHRTRIYSGTGNAPELCKRCKLSF